MSENIVDSALAELPSEAPAKTEALIDTPEKQEATPEPSEPQPEEAQKKPSDEVEFPKKAINAISRRDRQIGKMRAEMAALQAEIERFRSAQVNQPQNQRDPNSPPTEDQFENYGDFLEAKLLYKLKAEQAAQAKGQQELAAKTQEQQWAAEREQFISQKVEGHKQTIPDFVQVIEANADIADEFPQHVVQAFYEADDGAMAFYNLAREGKLEALASMNPYRAAMEIAKAQDKKVVVNKVTNAPQPIASARGNGSGAKSLDNMNWSEMKQFLKQ